MSAAEPQEIEPQFCELYCGIFLVDLGGKLVNPHQVAWIEGNPKDGSHVVVHFASNAQPMMVHGLTLAEVRQILKEG